MGKFFQCAFILLGVLLVIIGIVGLVDVPALYQTIIYDDGNTNEDINQTWEGLLSTNTSSMDGWAISKISLMTYGDIKFQLQAVDASYFKLFPQAIKSGRILLTQDYKYNDYCIVLNEALSQSFFGTNSSVGRYITLDKHQYKVVGVVNESSIGVSMPVAYVTRLTSEPDLIILNCRTISSDAYQYISHRALVSGLWENSVTYSLYAETLKETLLIRIVVALLLLAIGAKGIYLLMAFIRRTYHEYKASLKMEYWHKNIISATIKTLCSMVILGAIMFGLYYLVLWLINPVYYFPEIMTSSGLDTYLRGAWSSVRYYTPQLHRIHLCAQFLHGGMALILVYTVIIKICRVGLSKSSQSICHIP